MCGLLSRTSRFEHSAAQISIDIRSGAPQLASRQLYRANRIESVGDPWSNLL